MAEQQRHGPLGNVLRAAISTLAIVLVSSMATGWLYLLRAGLAHWPGPRVADALPLNELAGTDGVPLIGYLAVAALAGTLLGLVARAVRLDRLTAALSLAAGTGLWLLAVDAFCLFVVRQVPLGQAVRAAVRLQPVYLTAALAGAGGALFARGGQFGGRAARLLSALVALAGLLDLLSALVPRLGGALNLLVRFAPHAVSPAAHILLVPAGVLLLISARGLARGNRRAWRLAAGLLGLSVLLQLLRGPDYAAAVVTGLVTIGLLARRDDFRYGGDPAAQPPALLRLGGPLLLALGYGVAALWAYRTAAGLPFSLPAALHDTLRAMTGQLPADVDLLPGEFAEWFPLSVLSIVAIGVAWAAAVWLRPWHQRLFPDRQRRAQAEAAVRQWGGDTLAPFALRADKEWFQDGRTLIAYRVVRGVALVSGDPVGPAEEAGRALASFLDYARARSWRTAVLGAADRLLPSYRELGLHPVYHGDEAVIDTGAFSLDGRPMRATRQAVHRLERAGFQAEVITAGEVGPALRAELAAVERAWLGSAPRKGFAMELDSLFRLDGSDAVFVIGRDDRGRVNGFLHLAVCQPSRSLSLSTMPRWRDTPNGFTAWLIVQAAGWAAGHGYGYLSLNFSPFAGLLASQDGLPRIRRLERRALLRLKAVLALQLDNLLRYNGQFQPAWRPRYLILQAWTDLPRVAVAAMAAEGYLPHAALIRGRGWAPAPSVPDVPVPDVPVADVPVADVPVLDAPVADAPVAGALVPDEPASPAREPSQP
jgi:lysyl-tRNA synthetase, class II